MVAEMPHFGQRVSMLDMVVILVRDVALESACVSRLDGSRSVFESSACGMIVGRSRPLRRFRLLLRQARRASRVAPFRRLRASDPAGRRPAPGGPRAACSAEGPTARKGPPASAGGCRNGHIRRPKLMRKRMMLWSAIAVHPAPAPRSAAARSVMVSSEGLNVSVGGLSGRSRGFFGRSSLPAAATGHDAPEPRVGATKEEGELRPEGRSFPSASGALLGPLLGGAEDVQWNACGAQPLREVGLDA